MGGGGGVEGTALQRVANMGSVVGCEREGELAICVRLAQAPADHLLRWQKTRDEVEVGFGDGCRSHLWPFLPGWREFLEGLVDGFRLDLAPRGRAV